MEKSIESIWKDGFIRSQEFIAPKLINLYNRKSEHIVDRFTRMFKINLLALAGGSFLVLALSWWVDIPYMGIGLFVLVNILAFINYKLMNGLNEIDKNVNCYQYLTTFDKWLKQMISYNQKFARIFYPLALLSVLAGYWFGPIGGDIPGEDFLKFFVTRFPDGILFFSAQNFLAGVLIVVLSLVALAAGRIYKWDLTLVYGRVIKKMDGIIADMEELKK